MPDAITPDIFRHLVELAALELGDDEGDYLRRQLNGQLKAVRELAAIQVDDEVPIASHGVPYTPASSPPLRLDRAEPSPLAEAILAQSPEIDGRYVVVPDIPHTELE